ncbi:conjugal transfer protein TrbJ [Acetobacter nitrogenifigens DSM 23921 = NBRC 105050]|uniref:Conjugal transfer protein TrbJ n=1 Tax=Acetobacter nitrogenifigens DSM 23921 = NBRC 105050 TaxID=1120919 RepID=A0A511XAE4_9PROT|nr:P-type conjugative transfer protein TrbJ [Acetobacter nitrogenifigens]GBQ91300.1 conjugal transfer protein TrbJ [Acetobacter nitrogenifigens DSM 23921 = NBRC 105050]GEN59928.1 conjugal transfer protein TrbJ [Acetobacter nitrogenifigens DSM 23921 = NBRC 105050]
MIARRRSLIMAVAAGVFGTMLSPWPAMAQWEVFDSANFGQNVLQAARALQQIDNQITSLANQAQMLVNQAKNLALLPLSTLSTLQSTISQTTALLAQAQNIAYSVTSVEQQYQQAYTSISSSMSDSALFSQAQTRWQNAVGGFEDALKMQARAVGNIPSDSGAMTQLVSASQSSTGALQAAQAGNQLLALQSRQLSDVVAVLSANGRAADLERAREAAAEAESDALYQHFSQYDAYSPTAVSMFGSSGN